MKVIITGGGTGTYLPCHCYRRQDLAKNPDNDIPLRGIRKRDGTKTCPGCGYKIRSITVSGFNRKKLLKNIATLRDFIKGSREANRIIKEFQPDIVIGTAGYVCAPVIRRASKMGIRTYLHEQNAFPGLTNRMLEKYVEKIFISFPESEEHFKKKDKLVVTGNPVRRFIVSTIIDYRERLRIDDNEFLILSFGGSRGAEKINEMILELTDVIRQEPNARLIHITGRPYYDDFCQGLKDKGMEGDERILVLPYTQNMHEYMFASDLVICRSGAITVAELTASGKPAILIPSPNVTANHQYFNAKAIADKGGAVLIEEKDLTREKLKGVTLRLMHNREALNAMAKASASLGRTDGADAIYAELHI